MLSRKTEAEYFSREDWTAESTLKRLANFDFFRTRFTSPSRRKGAPHSPSVLGRITPNGTPKAKLGNPRPRRTCVTGRADFRVLSSSTIGDGPPSQVDLLD